MCIQGPFTYGRDRIGWGALWRTLRCHMCRFIALSVILDATNRAGTVKVRGYFLFFIIIFYYYFFVRRSSASKGPIWSTFFTLSIFVKSAGLLVVGGLQ
jgi:hypothetical protein